MTSPSGANATSATVPACPRISRSTRPSRAPMISTRCAEQTASSSPSGENAIPLFGPKVIRTMTSARPNPAIPDIMDHLRPAQPGSPVFPCQGISGPACHSSWTNSGVATRRPPARVRSRPPS